MKKCIYPECDKETFSTYTYCRRHLELMDVGN